jgi:hypothetical protein
VLLVAFATFFGSFLIRIANFETAFVGGVPQLSPFDEMYHAKRIVYSNQHVFRVLNFDESRGARGSFCPWPPLYDMAAGAVTRLLGGKNPSDIVARASWLPPVISSLAAALVAAWVSSRFGRSTGILAGVGIALSTQFIDRSRLGAIDHHFLEFPLVLGFIAATVVTADARSSREAIRAGGLLALALTVALLVQTALLLAAGIVAATILLLERHRAVARLAAASGFFLAAVIVWFYRSQQPAGYPDNEWYLGMPHAAALGAAAAACVAQFWLLARAVPVVRSALLAIVIGVAVLAAVPSAPEALLRGSQFLGGDPWLQSISEFQPLFRPDTIWWADLSLIGGGFFLTAAATTTRSWRRGRRVLFLPFALGYSLAAISSTRFLSVAGPLCAISGAIAIADLRKKSGALLCGAAVVVLLAPSMLLSAGRVIHPAPAIDSEMVPFVRAAGFLRSQTSPGRILGPWSWGHLFNVVGGKGVLLDNFGGVGGRTEFENGTGIILSPREKAVADYCAANGVRFIVLDDPLPYYAARAEMSGLPRGSFERPPVVPRSDPEPSRLMRSTFWWRAYFEGGRERPGGAPAGAAFQRFRLIRVETAPERSEIRSAVQIWELLPASFRLQNKTAPIARDRFRLGNEKGQGVRGTARSPAETSSGRLPGN